MDGVLVYLWLWMNRTVLEFVFADVTCRRCFCLVLFAVVAPLAGCGSGSSTKSVAASASTDGVSNPTVVIENYSFPAITVVPGATIKFIDRDAEPHTVTADDATFTAGPFDATAPGTLTAPAVPGTYGFHCKIHPTMHGVLVVRQP